MTDRFSARIKRWVKRGAYGVGLAYLALTVFINLEPHPVCPVEEHRFQGQSFDIEFCELGGGPHDKKMRLRIYDKSGHLLVWRIATFSKEDYLDYFSIEDDIIRYSNDTSDMRGASIPNDCSLKMPPTWIDWLEARLPGGIPGVKHCGTVSQSIADKARASWRIREQARLKQKEEAQRQIQTTPAQPPSSDSSR